MQSIRELYKVGNGPSSSHTMGPKRASVLFQKEYPNADTYEAILYGSLALTGKGHLTDAIIEKTFAPKEVKITFNKEMKCEVHPNTMDLIAYQGEHEIGKWRIYSVGGGTIQIEGKKALEVPSIYPLTHFDDIKAYCESKKMTLQDYVYEIEGQEIKQFLREVWEAMKHAVTEGLQTEGVIPRKITDKKTCQRNLREKRRKGNSRISTKPIIDSLCVCS